jgi:hypothetical protein
MRSYERCMCGDAGGRGAAPHRDSTAPVAYLRAATDQSAKQALPRVGGEHAVPMDACSWDQSVTAAPTRRNRGWITC